MLEGQVVGLRAIERADLEPLREWRNRPEFRRYFREYREISPDMQQRWYETVVLGDKRPHVRHRGTGERTASWAPAGCAISIG